MTTLRATIARTILTNLAWALSALLATGATLAAAAADGTPDVAFGNAGRVTIGIDIGGTQADIAEAVAPYPGGRIVVAGSAVVDSAGNTDIAVVRLLANGNADPSFGSGGIVVYDGGGDFDHVVDMLVQPDGRILVLALTATFPNPTGLTLTRLLASGGPDPGFGSFGTWNFSSSPSDVEPAALALRANGDIMIGGRVGSGVLGLRLSPAGVPQEGGASAVPDLQTVTDMVVTADGGLILVGSREFSGPDFDFVIARLTATLNGDPSFGTNAGYSAVPFDLGGTNGDYASSVGLLADGSLVVAGRAATALGDDVAILHLTATGTWTANGRFHFGFHAENADNDGAGGLAVQSDGAVVVVGAVAFDGTLDQDFGVARLSYTGGAWVLDPAFLNGGAFWLPFDVVSGGADDGVAVALAADGIVVAGRAQTGGDAFDIAVAKLTNSLIFANDFESADLSSWSSAVGTNG